MKIIASPRLEASHQTWQWRVVNDLLGTIYRVQTNCRTVLVKDRPFSS